MGHIEKEQTFQLGSGIAVLLHGVTLCYIVIVFSEVACGCDLQLDVD